MLKKEVLALQLQFIGMTPSGFDTKFKEIISIYACDAKYNNYNTRLGQNAVFEIQVFLLYMAMARPVVMTLD